MKRKTASVVCLLVGVVLTAETKMQPLNLKLGLWRMTYTYKSASATTVPPNLLAKMTPAQRARMEAKRKARALQGPRIETEQFCLTQDKLNNDAFERENGKSCQRTVLTSTGKVQEFRDECGGGRIESTIESRIEALDATDLKGSFQFKAGGSYAPNSTIEISGKWVAAECGKKKLANYSSR
jgi:Protein of unknown function (DUF3617)